MDSRVLAIAALCVLLATQLRSQSDSAKAAKDKDDKKPAPPAKEDAVQYLYSYRVVNWCLSGNNEPALFEWPLVQFRPFLARTERFQTPKDFVEIKEEVFKTGDDLKDYEEYVLAKLPPDLNVTAELKFRKIWCDGYAIFDNEKDLPRPYDKDILPGDPKRNPNSGIYEFPTPPPSVAHVGTTGELPDRPYPLPFPFRWQPIVPVGHHRLKDPKTVDEMYYKGHTPDDGKLPERAMKSHFHQRIHIELKLSYPKNEKIFHGVEGVLIQANHAPFGMGFPFGQFYRGEDSEDVWPCRCEHNTHRIIPCLSRPDVEIVAPTVAAFHYQMPTAVPKDSSQHCHYPKKKTQIGRQKEFHFNFKWGSHPCSSANVVEFFVLIVYDFYRRRYEIKKFGPYDFSAMNFEKEDYEKFANKAGEHSQFEAEEDDRMNNLKWFVPLHRIKSKESWPDPGTTSSPTTVPGGGPFPVGTFVTYDTEYLTHSAGPGITETSFYVSATTVTTTRDGTGVKTEATLVQSSYGARVTRERFKTAAIPGTPPAPPHQSVPGFVQNPLYMPSPIFPHCRARPKIPSIDCVINDDLATPPVAGTPPPPPGSPPPVPDPELPWTNQCDDHYYQSCHDTPYVFPKMKLERKVWDPREYEADYFPWEVRVPGSTKDPRTSDPTKASSLRFNGEFDVNCITKYPPDREAYRQCANWTGRFRCDVKYENRGNKHTYLNIIELNKRMQTNIPIKAGKQRDQFFNNTYCEPCKYEPTTIPTKPKEQNETFFKRTPHGACMVVAFLYIMPISNLIARHYKEVLATCEASGYRLWLWLHIILSMIAMMLAYAAYNLPTFWALDKHMWLGYGAMFCGGLGLITGWGRHKMRWARWLMFGIHSIPSHVAILLAFLSYFRTDASLLSAWIMVGAQITLIVITLAMDCDVFCEDRRVGMYPRRSHIPILQVRFEDAINPRHTCRWVFLIILSIAYLGPTLGMMFV